MIVRYIIVDTKTLKALYGQGMATMMFTTYDTAREVADQLFTDKSNFLIAEINLKP